jgi:hypothetical protein
MRKVEIGGFRNVSRWKRMGSSLVRGLEVNDRSVATEGGLEALEPTDFERRARGMNKSHGVLNNFVRPEWDSEWNRKGRFGFPVRDAPDGGRNGGALQRKQKGREFNLPASTKTLK